MRDEIIVYCKDDEDIKETFKYIKELNVFKESVIHKDKAEFSNYTKDKKREIRIKCITLKENARGIKGNIGLLTKSFNQQLKDNKDIYWLMIQSSINSYTNGIIAPLSKLKEII
ncbi:TPA: hypothetical protein ACH354_002247 [Clostridium perfringens]